MSSVFTEKTNILFPSVINLTEGSEIMKKIKFGIGGLLMLAATIVSDSARVIIVYMLAAFLHEMGHILAAKLMKIEIKEIKFGFFGVRIITDERLTSYKRELLLASAGPAVNIAIFIALLLYFCVNGGEQRLFEAADVFLSGGAATYEGYFAFFALSSLVQAIFNLMPVNTFDGGRILYCAVAESISERAAAYALSVTTALSAFVLWTAAMYLMLRVSSGLGIFVFAACIFASAPKKGNSA